MERSEGLRKGALLLAWGASRLLPVAIVSHEWQTPDTPPVHGNWGARLPVVHRWAYDYSVPGAPEDFIPQTVPHEEVAVGGEHLRAEAAT